MKSSTQKKLPQKIIDMVKEFQKDVEENLAQDVHLGSTDLAHAINSLFYNHSIKPEDLGLQTTTEIRMIGSILEHDFCEREKE